MHRILETPQVAAFSALLGPGRAKAIVAGVLAAERARLTVDTRPADVVTLSLVALGHAATQGLVPVINATGVVLHTNLGRAPLAEAALAEAAATGSGYSNLEYDLESGTRGSRHGRVSPLICEATGAEDALVVNNCAAAMLLVLDTFAREGGSGAREVIVARDQLIEIGGGFRLPDVLARSGARLVEVGTTNKTYVRDFERALSAKTALLLRAHRSNFSLEGFTAEASASELALLGARTGVPVVEDLGSGALVDLRQYGLPYERTAADAISDGVDLVAFSGDKLLGGPQAGILAGRRSAVARLRANPLLRALRVDKATLAALGATLRLALVPSLRERIPLFAMLGRSPASLRARAESLLANIGHQAAARAVEMESLVGGGSLPHARLPSAGLALRGGERVAAALRRATPPIVARVEGDATLLDLRTVEPRDDDVLARAIRAALEP